MPPVFRNDPYGEFNFLVTINGISDDGTSVRGGFSEVTGLEVEIVPVEYRTGNDPSLATRKLPGLHKFTNITLKRGVIGDLALWNWINGVLNGNVRRADGSILAEQRVHGLAVAVDRPIEVVPPSPDRDRGFIHPPVGRL